MKWNVGCLALTLSLAAPALAGAQVLPDRSVAPAGDGAIATLTLTDGTIHRATAVQLLRSLQMIKMTAVGGKTEYVSANRVRSITGVGGEDLGRRVLVDGRRLGTDVPTTNKRFTPQTGSLVLGSDLALLRTTGAGDHETALQLPFRVGTYVLPWLELEPSASVVFAGFPVLEGEISELIRFPSAPGHSRFYLRIFQGAFLVTSGERMAPTLGAGIGVEVPGLNRAAMRLECGYSRIYRATDIASRDLVSLRLGASVFR